ncbi:MAG TPA: hypothetical protein DCQ31_12800 [Bacteroidales bacterium]|nr:hypothetical protein [Bacteroidales bacterium]
MSKVRLDILGLSYSHSGAYALVLSESNGNRRMPIIIGAAEAQSIAIRLENLRPIRPLTHDLFYDFATAFSIEVTEVVISKVEEGIFYAELHCLQAEKNIVIDARTSDAIALALRFNCSIYTIEEVIDKAGFVIDDESFSETAAVGENTDKGSEYDAKTMEELEQLLISAIETENYEEASLLRDAIKRKTDEAEE